MAFLNIFFEVIFCGDCGDCGESAIESMGFLGLFKPTAPALGFSFPLGLELPLIQEGRRL